MVSSPPRHSRRWLPAVLLVLLAAVFRLPALGTIPSALFRDEIEKGYTAWELASTARYGRLSLSPAPAVLPSGRFPLFIEVYGVKTSAIYQWLSTPFVAIGGLNAVTTRLVAALAGILAVLFTFLWVRRVWGTQAALWSGFWLALSPWHVVFSRWAQQGITEPLWLVLTLFCFQKGRSPGATDRSRAAWWAGSAVFAGLAFYAYAVGRVFVPLWLAALAITHFRLLRRRWKPAILATLVFLLLAVPVALAVLGPEGSARFNRISVFGQTSSLPAALWLFAKNWLHHFDPGFLFLYGDANPRHSLPGLGLMYLVQAPLVVLGFVVLLRRRKPMDLFLIGWILLYPFSASLTTDGIPHALRSIVGLPAWPVVTGIATVTLFRLIAGMRRPERTRRLAGALVALALVIPSGFSLSQSLYRRWPAASALNFGWPAEQVTLALLHPDKGGSSSNSRWLSGYVPYAPHRLLFHGRVDPRVWQSKGLEALPAKLLPPAPLHRLWGEVGEGDRLGLLAPDLSTLPPSAYRVEKVIRLPPDLGDGKETVGAIVEKTP